MKIPNTTWNLISLMPQAVVIIDIANQYIIFHNDKAKALFHLASHDDIQNITCIINHTAPIDSIYSAVRSDLHKYGKSTLHHINVRTTPHQIARYDVHISYVDTSKTAVFVIFSISDHELKRMTEQNIYYDNLSSVNYSYPFYLDVRAKRMELFNPELEQFNLSMSMENYPEQVLTSGVLCEDDVEAYLKTVERMYKGEPPEGTFRCYDPNGELLRYTVNYVVHRDENDLPIEVSGDFIIQSDTNIDTPLETQSTLCETQSSIPQQKVVLAHQIKAHFFFNTLNTISALCKQDAAKADSAIRTFATYMRSYMHLINEYEIIAFEQELVLVKSTLEIEKLRFPDSFIYELELDEVDFYIPPLTLQPIVENALLHGLRRTGHHGTLRISSRRVDHSIHINICDNGLGFDTAILNKQKSIGIQNIIQRIALMVDGIITIESELMKGTNVCIQIPI